MAFQPSATISTVQDIKRHGTSSLLPSVPLQQPTAVTFSPRCHPPSLPPSLSLSLSHSLTPFLSLSLPLSLSLSQLAPSVTISFQVAVLHLRRLSRRSHGAWTRTSWPPLMQLLHCGCGGCAQSLVRACVGMGCVCVLDVPRPCCTHIWTWV